MILISNGLKYFVDFILLYLLVDNLYIYVYMLKNLEGS